jgi:hypothetical protein
MLKRLTLVATIGAVLLLTTACAPVAGGPTATPTDSAAQSESPTPSASPTSSPPAGSTTVTAGDCTEAEMQDAQPTVYTVYTGDSTNPVTIHYTAFNHDGSLPVDTLTAVGPVISIIGYACSSASQSATWTLTATHSVVGSLACVLDFGGLLVNTKSDGQEDPNVTVDCSGNPGE